MSNAEFADSFAYGRFLFLLTYMTVQGPPSFDCSNFKEVSLGEIIVSVHRDLMGLPFLKPSPHVSEAPYSTAEFRVHGRQSIVQDDALRLNLYKTCQP